ncbi:MAG: sugar ABC transporter permease [Firmicutes bacterium]|nr:sugar ABC transporter permease [Bacillota bacterium]
MTTNRRRKYLLLNEENPLYAYLYLAPYLALFVAFIALPIIESMRISLYDWSLIGPPPRYVGLGNYAYLFTEPTELFLPSLKHTLQYAVGSVPLFVVASLFLALAVDAVKKGKAFFQISFVLPMVINVAAISIIWIWIFDPTSGLLNYYARQIGLPPQNLLGHEETAMWTIVAVSFWWGVGFPFLVYLSGLQDIPQTMYEAARIDGANAWHCFKDITLPLLRPTLLFICVMQVIGAFQVFGQVYILTGGGPYDSTRVVVQHMYLTGFQDFEMGLAAAMAWILFSILIVFTLIQFRVFRVGERLEY